MKLSDTQLFILKTLREGGKLIRGHLYNYWELSASDSADTPVMSTTAFKLFKNELIQMDNSFKLDGYTSYCLTNRGLEAIQEAEIKEHKRVSESF